MANSNNSTPPEGAAFDFDAYPEDTCFHDRRASPSKGGSKPPGGVERRRSQKRRRRIDPTTFEKQYSPEEMEFMNAMQYYKSQSGKSFPNYGEVLDIASKLGYRKVNPPSEIAGIAPASPPPE